MDLNGIGPGISGMNMNGALGKAKLPLPPSGKIRNLNSGISRGSA